jgi:hypothetical protein
MSKPTKNEIFQWLKEQGYQKEEGPQEYSMYFDIDMPKILEDYYAWRQKNKKNE